MASKMKKLFHRKKDGDELEAPNQITHQSPYSDRSDPGLRTSLYDSTPQGGLPKMGEYPIKGNDGPNVLKKKPSRRSSIRSWRSSSGSQQAVPYRSPTPDQYGARGMASSPPSNNNTGVESYGPEQPGIQKRWSRSQLPLDLAALNLGNEAPTLLSSTSTTTTTRTSLGASAPKVAPQPQRQGYNDQTQEQNHQAQGCTNPVQTYADSNQGYTRPKTSSIRPVNPSDVQQAYTSSRSQTQPRNNYGVNGDGDRNRQPDYEGAARRNRTPIPRKVVGAGSVNVPSQSSTSSHLQKGNGQHASTDKALPFVAAQSYQGKRNSRDQSVDRALLSAPATSNNTYASRSTEPAPVVSSVSNRDEPVIHAQTGHDAQAILDRAKSSSKDTEIIEKYAPAVVHETVHKDVHHIRQEVVTREIHNHDVYHRILPVIDVEVLPPRHFLPVEGGGLVEISADEVPGRCNAWIIAETASKIPSDQAAPQGARGFTARTFTGQEGDAIKYMTPEGYERTEQTWVHPPEMETGARDTGQSWPVVFGNEVPEKGTYGYKSPKQPKKRSSKIAAVVQSSSAQRDDGLGRGA